MNKQAVSRDFYLIHKQTDFSSGHHAGAIKLHN